MTIQCHNSPINPFLVNPVMAIYRGQDIGITHAYRTSDGIELSTECPVTKKWSQALLADIKTLNEHETGRLRQLLAKTIGES